MAKESNEDKKAYCTEVQRVPWHQTGLIIRNISTFLGPSDLSRFRLVCKNWKEESSSIWKYHRTRLTLLRYSELGLKSKAYDPLTPKVDPQPLTVFSEDRPLEMECNIDCVWAEELRDFFSRAKGDDAQLMETSFLFIKLKKWNRFGNFPSGVQQGAKWFLNEVADKVVQLTLDKCNVSISQNEFFPTLCRMTQLKELIMTGTCFQLRPSLPVEPTLAEISPLPNLKVVEMIYEKCTVKRMPNYNFPWKIFLGAGVELERLLFSFSNWSNLNFAIHQFSKMIMVENSVNWIIFKNLLEPNQEPIIPKFKVMEMVKEPMKKLGIEISTLHSQGLQQDLAPDLDLPFSSNFKCTFLVARGQTRSIGIKFQDHEDVSTRIDTWFANQLLQEVHRLNEN